MGQHKEAARNLFVVLAEVCKGSSHLSSCLSVINSLDSREEHWVKASMGREAKQKAATPVLNSFLTETRSSLNLNLKSEVNLNVF